MLNFIKRFGKIKIDDTNHITFINKGPKFIGLQEDK